MATVAAARRASRPRLAWEGCCAGGQHDEGQVEAAQHAHEEDQHIRLAATGLARAQQRGGSIVRRAGEAAVERPPSRGALARRRTEGLRAAALASWPRPVHPVGHGHLEARLRVVAGSKVAREGDDLGAGWLEDERHVARTRGVSRPAAHGRMHKHVAAAAAAQQCRQHWWWARAMAVLCWVLAAGERKRERGRRGMYGVCGHPFVIQDLANEATCCK